VAHTYEQEAAAWIATEIERLRNLSYSDLLSLKSQPAEHRPMETADGKALVMETQLFWDDGKRQNLRVIVDVWDFRVPGHSVIRIAGRSFIRAPNGSFVGE
jgi:hypothetical protein